MRVKFGKDIVDEATKGKARAGFLAWEAGIAAKNLTDDLRAVAKAMKKGDPGSSPHEYAKAVERLEGLKKEIDRCLPDMKKEAQR